MEALRPYVEMITEPPEPSSIAILGSRMMGPGERWSQPRQGIRGFLLLPPIQASPMDTPCASICAADRAEGTSSAKGIPIHAVVSTPTWTSTPPTPPTKLTRHLSASFPQRTAPTQPAALTPLASFSASMHTHATVGQPARLKRCISIPNLLWRSPGTFPESPLRGSTSFPSKTPFPKRTMGLQYTPDNDSDVDDNNSPHRPKAIFHISNPTSDNEDEGAFHSAESRPRSINGENSPDGDWSNGIAEDVWGQAKSKDSCRKFHALKELLSTEMGYLADLKAFVTVYLRNLPTLVTRTPTLSTFGRASSFTAGPWPSPSHLQPGAIPSIPSSATSDIANVSLPASPSKEIPKPNVRYLFTDNELELVSRNAEDILQLHDRFLMELQETLEPFGFSPQEDVDEPPSATQLQHLEPAIRIVSSKFATEASRFNAYQTFCAGHPEALDLVRRVSQQHPVEWEAFEQKCASMVSEMMEGSKFALSQSPLDALAPTAPMEDRARALSLPSLDSAVRTLRIRYPSSATAPRAEIKRESPVHRIAFVDYLIKPVQRICKYPLLFDQVLSNKVLRAISTSDTATRPHVDVIVKSAAQAMRHVALSVDEARHRQDAAIQTSLVNSRMFLGMQALAAPPSDSMVQGLTVEFLTSLGTCTLAGALDVIHHHPQAPVDATSSVKAKYYGAFLYMGGYLILVKVQKGRRYEPRHWFDLSHFAISDFDEGEGEPFKLPESVLSSLTLLCAPCISALLPNTIRLSICDHQFDLAASCQREKDVWLAHIHSSLRDKPNWINEPTPSFKLDDKGGLMAALHSEGELVGGVLPTIQSIPELPNNNSDGDLSEAFFPLLRCPSRKAKLRRSGLEMTSRSEQQPSSVPTSRRSSTTSVRSIFVPLSDAESIVIRRSSPAARQHVDQAMQDVISQSCITARTYAFSRDAELFRSGSTALSRTKSRLSRHESIRVPRSRTSDALDTIVSKPSPIQNRRQLKKLSISSAPPVIIDETNVFSRSPTSTSLVSSFPPDSYHSSAVPSLLLSDASASTSSSATLATPPLVTPPDTASLKPSRSLVRGVKDLFTLRSNHSPEGSPRGHRPAHRWSLGRRPKTAPEARGLRLSNTINTSPIGYLRSILPLSKLPSSVSIIKKELSTRRGTLSYPSCTVFQFP
ncbi:hypothetical protein NMY22_g2471 [Coprinellus aureogranulatus]|nr:hypothetical protein NMY22_g2471 [Coprinellus aureogranulatus]